MEFGRGRGERFRKSGNPAQLRVGLKLNRSSLRAVEPVLIWHLTSIAILVGLHSLKEEIAVGALAQSVILQLSDAMGEMD